MQKDAIINKLEVKNNCLFILVATMQQICEVFQMKKHRFWAFAAVFCFAMLFYTGYKHK